VKEAYKRFNFREPTLRIIELMEGICMEYAKQGFVLTVRQLYYQLVARDIVPNTERSYKNITNIANDARLAGLIDWDMIEDRTRAFVRRQRWDSGAQIMESAARSFHMDMWPQQPSRVFVIIEKEALVGVLEPTCRKWDVPLLAARGYPSSTVLREFAELDLIPADAQGLVILHLGDHDPSGIDMTRDLRERIDLFARGQVQLVRIALNMEQIEQFNPPPNPAKTTDSRFADYQRKYGTESWELDALPPQELAELVETEIKAHIEPEEWLRRHKAVERIRRKIEKAAREFKG
jgi:hypothetical protein